MKLFLKSLLVIVMAAVLGTGTTIYILARPETLKNQFIPETLVDQFIQVGPWATSLELGSKNAGMYVKAIVARIGLFALNKTETLYFTAITDTQGEPLNAKYNYRIEGENLDTRWWSITVYGKDHYLIPNPRKRYAYSMNNLKRKPDGSYIIFLSKAERKGNWLPTGKDDQDISLTLRLYNPAPSVYENIKILGLPRIIKEVQS